MIQRGRHSSLALSLLAFLLLIGAAAQARVSWSWGAGSNSSKALKSAGGKSVYSAGISLNGADAQLSVFSFNETSSQLVTKLGRLFKGGDFKHRGGRMAYAVIHDDNTVLRMIVLQVSDSSRTLAIKVEQSARDYKASKNPPIRHLMREVPEFPGSKPVFYAKNRDTDFQIASSTALVAPSDVTSFYTDSLGAQGWTKPLEDSSSLHFFVKNEAVCIVMATRPERAGRSTITLLHKTHGVK